jgi:hypothetical protein
MRITGWTALMSLAMAGSVSAATLGDLVPQEADAIRCWQRVYDEAHLAGHPDQLVTEMVFGAGFQPPDTEMDLTDGLTLFGMHVTLRGGKTGVASGGCWEGDGEVRCGVDCDGGSVVVDARDDGTLLIDLGATGYIRLEGECGGGDGFTSFPLEPGVDDEQFLLRPASTKVCKGLVPVWTP